MTKCLAAKNVETMIVSTTAGPEWQVDGVPTVTARIAKSRFMPSSFYYSSDFGQWIEKRVCDFDIVHVHTIFNFPSAWACRVARRNAIPYIVRTCGMLDPWSLSQGRLKKAVWMRLVERANLSGAAAIHFTSVEERDAASKFIGTVPCAVIPLGVDLPPARQARRAAERKNILFLSRLHPKKGLEKLIEALRRLKSARNDFALIIAGRGDVAYERKLRQLIDDVGLASCTTWCGFIEGAKKEALFNSADIFVLPSYQENFGIAVVEAMSYGIPVVISDRVNIHSMVAESNAGIVVGADVESLTSAIRRLLDDDVLRTLCGANAAAAALLNFTWDRIGQDLIALYERCIGARSHSTSNGEHNRRLGA